MGPRPLAPQPPCLDGDPSLEVSSYRPVVTVRVGGGRIPTTVSDETVAAIDTGIVVASIGDLDDRLGNVFEGSLELRLGDVFGRRDQDRDVPVLHAGERLGVDNLDVDVRRHGRHPPSSRAGQRWPSSSMTVPQNSQICRSGSTSDPLDRLTETTPERRPQNWTTYQLIAEKLKIEMGSEGFEPPID